MAIDEERTNFLRHRSRHACGVRAKHRTSPTTTLTIGRSVSQLFCSAITKCETYWFAHAGGGAL
jgi:hypothetical protein